MCPGRIKWQLFSDVIQKRLVGEPAQWTRKTKNLRLLICNNDLLFHVSDLPFHLFKIITCSQSKSALKKDIASAHLPGETEGVVLDPE